MGRYVARVRRTAPGWVIRHLALYGIDGSPHPPHHDHLYDGHPVGRTPP